MTTTRKATTKRTNGPAKPAPETEEQVIAELACKLGFGTLQTQNRDDLDFHQVAVWNIREALSEAFHAGARSVLAAQKMK
jgi:Family of unknown function (DUF6900)